MGLDRKIIFPAGNSASWPATASLLAECGIAVQMRMINGELAFPDETPPNDWRELRIGVPAGMITLRREPDGVRTVIWGNSTPEMQRAWDAVTWALAAAGAGRILTDAGEQNAQDFASTTRLFE